MPPATTPRKLGDARRPRTPANQPPAGGAFPVAAGQLPMIPGQVRLTDMEKTELKKYGWKEGDPIPASLPNLFAAVQANKAAADDMPVFNPEVADFQLRMPVEQKLSDLPPDQQIGIARALQDAKVQTEFFQKQTSHHVADAGPGINAAINAAIVDDLSAERNVAAPPQSAEEDTGAGGAVTPARCINCGHDHSVKEVPDPTDNEKLRWLIAQEGMLRFSKEYSLLGGRVSVTFRTLTSKESDLAFRQVALDGTQDLRTMDAPDGEDQYWRNLMLYRMVMGLERFVSETAGVVDNPILADWQIDREDYPAPNTKLYGLLKHVTESLFPTENLRRQIGAAFHKFQILVEHLEANAENDPFWQGVGTRS